MAKKTPKAERKKAARRRQQEERDRSFPPRVMTAAEQGRAMAAASPLPETDWRPALTSRFGIDGNLTPRQLDGFDPGEPGRYDFADIQEAHALALMPLWRIDASQVKLMLDYGYDPPSVFRLALLMAEADPALFVEGSVYGELLPSVAAAARQPEKAAADPEQAFRYKAVLALIKRLEREPAGASLAMAARKAMRQRENPAAD